MKRSLVALGLILILVATAGAQDVVTGLTGKGIKAGLNLSDNVGDDADNMDMKLGFGGGAFITYSFSPSFAIQPEVLFMMKGSEYEESVGSLSMSMKTKLTYIEIPILLKYTVPTQGNIKPSLFLGPAVALNMSSKMTFESSGGLDGDVSEEIDLKDATRSMDFGLVFGGGIGIQMEKMMVTFDIRYTMGMTKLIDYEEFNIAFEDFESEFVEIYELTEDPDIKNTNISFILGLSF